jgi:hypothetical protein
MKIYNWVFKYMLLATDNNGGTVFHMAANVNGIEVFQGLFNFVKENPTRRR